VSLVKLIVAHGGLSLTRNALDTHARFISIVLVLFFPVLPGIIFSEKIRFDQCLLRSFSSGRWNRPYG